MRILLSLLCSNNIPLDKITTTIQQMASQLTKPTWMDTEIYRKARELQRLCSQLQYSGTIICEPSGTTIIQDSDHTCRIPAALPTPTAQMSRIDALKIDLLNTVPHEITPVDVPMTTKETWITCFNQIKAKYNKAIANKQKCQILAYAFHLGNLLQCKKEAQKVDIGSTRRKVWTRVHLLFSQIGYDQIYRTNELVLKDLDKMTVPELNEIIRFCRHYRGV
jgi:hypothetical protein